jgi:hypothetical protein
MTTPNPDPSDRSSSGPPLPVPAIAFAVLTVLAVVVSIKVPTPSASAQTVLDYQTDHGTALRLSAFLQFAAALPLAIWAATVHGRLRALGVTAVGNTMALAGGILAAASLALGGLITWTSAETAHLGDAALARVLAELGFVTGGVGFVVPFALLVAGVAVPSLILELMPRPAAVVGLVLAAVGMLATATLLTATLDPTLPVVRFGGLLWIVVASILLSRTRRTAR